MGKQLKRLHNFSMLPLKSGKQLRMKCPSAFTAAEFERICLGSKLDVSTTNQERELNVPRDEKRPVVERDNDDEIAEVRKKLRLDLTSELDRMEESISRNEEEEDVMIPRNLRRRGFEKTDKVKFTLQLSRNEIEEDFIELLGRKPPLRPKMRPKHVQKRWM